MLVSIDPATNSIGLLSIPRDLWVQIPGQEERDRINRAYFLGEVRATGGGPRLLQQTVSWNLGMRVHNYVLVDLRSWSILLICWGASKSPLIMLSTMSAIPTRITASIPFIWSRALTYSTAKTRSALPVRGMAITMFCAPGAAAGHRRHPRTRFKHQFPTTYRQVPALLNSLNENLQTGLNIQQIVQLAFYAREVDAENIQMRVMNFEYVQEYTTEEYQQQVLIPIVERLPVLLRDTFGDDYAP